MNLSSYQNARAVPVSSSNSSDAPWKIKQYGSSIVVHNYEDYESALLLDKHPNVENDAGDEQCTWFGRLVRSGIKRMAEWLKQDATDYDEHGKELHERCQQTAASYVRRHFYNPMAISKLPNQYNAAILTGITVGLWIVPFKFAIEQGLDFIWDCVPNFLVYHGVFEQLGLPSYLYTALIITTGCTVCGLMFEKIKTMPNQNSLLDDLAVKGRISAQHLWPLVGLAIAAMWSGLPLGPELPLLLIFSMFGSWMGQQLGLDGEQNRAVLYYSMAAAVGAFFSYPIGAFLFVLEVPHRMGVLHRMGRLHAQLLGPCAGASLTGTIIHSYVSGHPVQRLFGFPGKFPEGLTYTIPGIVLTAVLVGSCTGMMYTKLVLRLKNAVHGISDQVTIPAVQGQQQLPKHGFHDIKDIDDIRDGNTRAAKMKLLVHGAVYFAIGLIYSVICMTLPHVFSWGEAQLQNVLDSTNIKGDLPFFGGKGSPLLAPFAQCMPSPGSAVPALCLMIIPLAKTVAIGIVLGTSIQCGHFWGPAYVGAVVGQLALHLVGLFGVTSFNSSGLFLLCVMASSHVVTYRSPLGISFLLMQSAGYDIIVSTAVLAAAHMSLYISRDVVFYKSQHDHTPVADETF